MTLSIPIGLACGVALQNWAGNYIYRARVLHTPSSLKELREIVLRAPWIRALGSRHSFTDIGDSVELVSLDRMASPIVTDRHALTVTCGAEFRYGELATALELEGLALAKASLPHIAVGGAISTATHGPGNRNGNLSTAVGI